MSTSSLFIPSTLAPDATETSLYASTEQTADLGTSEAAGGLEPPDNPKQSADTVPGVQIETDVLLLIPETVPEEEPPSLNKISSSGRPESRARSFKEEDYYDEVISDNDDLEPAEALVFRPLFRHRKQNSRRRVDKNRPSRNKDPYRRVPFKYCPPCRYYFF
jgi:hypothetical protein